MLPSGFFACPDAPKICMPASWSAPLAAWISLRAAADLAEYAPDPKKFWQAKELVDTLQAPSLK